MNEVHVYTHYNMYQLAKQTCMYTENYHIYVGSNKYSKRMITVKTVY